MLVRPRPKNRLLHCKLGAQIGRVDLPAAYELFDEMTYYINGLNDMYTVLTERFYETRDESLLPQIQDVQETRLRLARNRRDLLRSIHLQEEEDNM